MIPAKLYKKIFLIDSLGAFTSCVFLGLVLPMLNVGLPDRVLYSLSLVALIFSIYSLYCHLSKNHENKSLLKIIVLLNFIYILATVYVLLSYYEQISLIGKAYLLIEMLLIFIVVLTEKNIILNINHNKGLQK